MLLINNKYNTVIGDDFNIVQQLRVQWYSHEISKKITNDTVIKGVISIQPIDTKLMIDVSVELDDRIYRKKTIELERYGTVDLEFVVNQSESYVTDNKVFTVKDVVVVNDTYYYMVNYNGVFCVLDGKKVDDLGPISFTIYPFNMILPANGAEYTTIGPVAPAEVVDSLVDSLTNPSKSDIITAIDNAIGFNTTKIDGKFKLNSSEDVIVDVLNNYVNFKEPEDTFTITDSPKYIEYINGKRLQSGNVTVTMNLIPPSYAVVYGDMLEVNTAEVVDTTGDSDNGDDSGEERLSLEVDRGDVTDGVYVIGQSYVR